MDIIKSIFQRRKPVPESLECFGFRRTDEGYTYTKTLSESGFLLTVTVLNDESISADIKDCDFNEPYTLHLTDNASGAFVGKVREEYESILTEIRDKCFVYDVFKSRQTLELISYIRFIYKDELEFLWQKALDNAIWRRKDTEKWYAVLMTVSKRKLGLASDEVAEILNLHALPEDIDALVDNRVYFRGWHMNKRSWLTIVLDGSVPNQELYGIIAESYRLAVK